MEPLLVYPDPPPPGVLEALRSAGWEVHIAANPEDAVKGAPEEGWPGAIIITGDDADGAFAVCRALRRGEDRIEPLLLVVRRGELRDLDLREELFDDFVCVPVDSDELEARLRHMFWRTGRGTRPELVEYKDLVLNLETYQAALQHEPLDLTYMEYELLKFFASHPGKVFSREMLLSRVWGYDYYGGARTVDVHVRRLRAKLGDAHAPYIQTVRSVGYRFGHSRWSAR